MGNSRGSRCSETDQLIVYVDGVPFGQTKKDVGCVGDVHIFWATTTLVDPVSYKWYIDSIHNPPVSEKYNYGYTFDDKTHTLILVASNTKCAIQTTIEVRGSKCTECKIESVSQTAFIPAGEVVSLVDTKDRVYKVGGSLFTECQATSRANLVAAKAIARAIRIANDCKPSLLNAQVFYNKSSPNCLTLHIINSPIKFKSIFVGTVNYLFT